MLFSPAVNHRRTFKTVKSRMRTIRKNYDNPSDTDVVLRRQPRGFNAAGLQQIQNLVTPNTGSGYPLLFHVLSSVPLGSQPKTRNRKNKHQQNTLFYTSAPPRFSLVNLLHVSTHPHNYHSVPKSIMRGV